MVRFDATQPVSGLGAGGRGVAVGPTARWQAAETPGFGRLASVSAELAFSHREGIVRRLMAGEAVSAAPRAELIRRYEQAISAGTIASPAPRSRTADALFEELGRLFTVARESPASAAQEDIDWAGIELMLRLLDAPGPVNVVRRCPRPGRTSPGAAASLDIDGHAIEMMLRLLDASGHSA